jgi:hypothetical protein
VQPVVVQLRLHKHMRIPAAHMATLTCVSRSICPKHVDKPSLYLPDMQLLEVRCTEKLDATSESSRFKKPHHM